jgi:3-hydroxyisobutyrate dehydrogenase
MLPLRCAVQAATKIPFPRADSTSFIGLGRMGYQMALNLFSKQYKQANNSHFVVCDVVPDAARSFCFEFTSQYPDAYITIASTPEE